MKPAVDEVICTYHHHHHHNHNRFGCSQRAQLHLCRLSYSPVYRFGSERRGHRVVDF